MIIGNFMKIKRNFIKLSAFFVLLCILFVSVLLCFVKKNSKNDTEETSVYKETLEIKGENKEENTNSNESEITKIYVSSNGKATRGSSVDIAVCIENNFGVLGLLLTVRYDESVMTLKEAKNGKAFDALHYTPSGELSSGCAFLWDAPKIEEADIRNGEILILTFSIKENAPQGSYDVLLDVKENGAYDRALEKLSLTTENGKMLVE